MSGVVPTIGRIVHYRVTEANVEFIRARRNAVHSILRGNEVDVGDVFPLLIVRVWGAQPSSYVNGQLFLDGNDQIWVTSTKAGEGIGEFTWPSVPAKQPA